MRRLESITDEMNDVMTYEWPDGRRVTFPGRMIREVGIERACEYAGLWNQGYDVPQGRVPVFQRGQPVGTVPALFDPMLIKSTSFFYEPRAGDFTRTSEGWKAADNLGPGDLEAVPGFVWERAASGTLLREDAPAAEGEA